ncbi:hypothetical protein H1R20_g3156, partial [Candolleomyces eurysporus]
MSRSPSLIKPSSKPTLKWHDQLRNRDSKTSTTDNPIHSIDGTLVKGLPLAICRPDLVLQYRGSFQALPGKPWNRWHPWAPLHTILIDGLDEVGREDRQAERLLAIRQTLLADDVPIRILITSRPERTICTAMGAGGYLDGRAYHLRLKDYDATEDLHRYLRRRLLVLSLRSGMPPSQWFTEDDIETFVRSASGQFIYVATVFKYISDRRDSPVHKLKEVLARTSRQDANLFATLDFLYIKILLEAARDAYSHAGLLLFRLYQVNNVFGLGVKLPVDILTAILGLENDGLENLVSYKATLVTLERDCEGELRLPWFRFQYRTDGSSYHTPSVVRVQFKRLSGISRGSWGALCQSMTT